MAEHSNKLEFGLFNHIEKTSGSSKLNELYDEHIKFIQQAEQAGFWGYHLAEHHATPLSMVPSPNLFLAALSRQTKKIRLGPMVYLLPFYNPLRLIYEICMLDNLADGRLEIGVGRGISPFEHDYYGIPTLQSREIFEEALEVIIKGLTNDRLTYRGLHFRFDDVPVGDLRTIQKPYPGLWYGALSPQSVIFAARHGMNIGTGGPVENVNRVIEVYREARQKSINTAENLLPQVTDPKIGPLRFVFVAETDSEGEKIARQAYEQYVRNIQNLWQAWSVTDNRTNIPFDLAVKGGVVICGSPARVHDEFAGQIAKSTFNYVMFNFKFGDLTASQSRRSMELFATKVMAGLIKQANAR